MLVLELVKELIETPGLSGFEAPVREKIIEKVKGFGETSVDGIGNLSLSLGQGKNHLAFVAHMDELGLIVSHIEDNGMVRVRKISADDRTLSGRVYNVWTRNGPVTGVIGLKAPHLVSDPEEMKKITPAEKLILDVGARSRKEVEKMGIRMLDPIVLKKNFDVINGKYVCARGIDNRLGCAVLIKALEGISLKNPGCRLTFVWSVQEEFSLRGASVISRLVKPDYVFAIDTFATADCPDAPPHYPPALLGKGPVLRAVDVRAIANSELRDSVCEIARKGKIPVQVGIGGGTTDGAVLQESGARMLPLCVAVRYTHSPVELAHMDDINNLVKLIIKIVEIYGRKK
jgi:putative aminopeptidase FrvX